VNYKKQKGFTLVEVLTVIAIITILIGLLIPSLNIVRRMGYEAKQRVQLSTISMALVTFKGDYGDYPPSNWTPAPFTGNYCGAQKLAEALLGRDLLGFNPQSNWSATDPTFYPLPGSIPDALFEANMNRRKGHYLDLASVNVFRLGNISPEKPGLYTVNTSNPLEPDTFVICDEYGRQNITMPNGDVIKAGAPVLYYKADATKKNMRSIFNLDDNAGIIEYKEQYDGRTHPLGSGPYDPFGNGVDYFYGTLDIADGLYGYIQDPRVTTTPWPYKADSFILISAGFDGMYGTDDDITNFKK
jgi:prepilin-type N-terminal cleavage/methylation domain-containing protein